MKALWTLVVFLMAILLVLLMVDAPSNLVAGLLALGCVAVIGTMIAAGLEEPR